MLQQSKPIPTKFISSKKKLSLGTNRSADVMSPKKNRGGKRKSGRRRTGRGSDAGVGTSTGVARNEGTRASPTEAKKTSTQLGKRNEPDNHSGLNGPEPKRVRNDASNTNVSTLESQSSTVYAPLCQSHEATRENITKNESGHSKDNGAGKSLDVPRSELRPGPSIDDPRDEKP